MPCQMGLRGQLAAGSLRKFLSIALRIQSKREVRSGFAWREYPGDLLYFHDITVDIVGFEGLVIY